jgi:hypothetical protein
VKAREIGLKLIVGSQARLEDQSILPLQDACRYADLSRF